MEDQKKQEVTASDPEVKPPNTDNKNKTLIIVIIILAFLVLGLGGLIAYMLMNQSEDSNTDEKEDSQLEENLSDEEEMEEDMHEDEMSEEDQPDEENEPEQPSQSQSVPDERIDCLYDDGSEKILFKLPKSWTCTQNPASANAVYGVSMTNGNLKLYVGVLLVAPCQNPSGCTEHVIYSGSKFKLFKVEDNYGGSTSYTTIGEFTKNGQVLQNLFVDLQEPSPQVRDLNQSEEIELSDIFDSISYP